MIVVIGQAAIRFDRASPARAVGMAPEIAQAAAAAGAAVEMLARIGDDQPGDEMLLALARSGVGHLAVMRDAALPTAIATPGEAETADDGGDADDEAIVTALLSEPEATIDRAGGSRPAVARRPALDPADVALGLRYLRDYRVVVLVQPLPEEMATVVAEAVAFAGAAVVVVASPADVVPAADPSADAPTDAGATILQAPPLDPDGAFARLVGRYAAALDRGDEPSTAFRMVTADGGWEATAG